MADNEQQDNEPWLVNEDGVWHMDTDLDGVWEDDSDYSDAIQDPLDIPSDQPFVDPSPLQLRNSTSVLTPDDIQDEPLNNLTPDDDDDDHWKRFHILSNAPQDHAFILSTPSQHSRTFMARLNREYRILSSSLPGTFFGNNEYSYHITQQWQTLSSSVHTMTGQICFEA